MGFDAGAVTSKLSFDTEEFSHNFAAVEAAMRLFPATLIELIENPLLGTIALFKELGEAGIEGVKKLIEGVSELGHEFQHLGLEAAKAGVSTEFLENWQLAGRTVEIGAQEISNGFKLMNEKASEAVGGDSSSIEIFKRIGISVAFLKEHLGDSEAIATKMADAFSHFGTAAERTDAGMKLLGRAGAGLVPLLAMGSEGIAKMGEEMGSLRGHVTDADTAVGAGFQRISLSIDDAWAGIKRAVEEPILQYFADHADELIPKITAIAATVKDLLGGAMSHIGPIIQDVLGLIENIGGQAGPVLSALGGWMGTIGSLLHSVWDILQPIVALIVQILLPVLQLMVDIIKPLLDLLITGLSTIGQGVQALIHGVDSTQYQAAEQNTIASVGRIQQDLGLNVNAEIKINSEDTAQRIADKLKPAVDEAVDKHVTQLGAHSKKNKVGRAGGGRSR